jgi:hypothetical protein
MNPEQVDCVACAPAGQAEFFPDDVRTHCARCGRPIHHRPHPLVPRTLPKLCWDCAFDASTEPVDFKHYRQRVPYRLDAPARKEASRLK